MGLTQSLYDDYKKWWLDNLRDMPGIYPNTAMALDVGLGKSSLDQIKPNVCIIEGADPNPIFVMNFLLHDYIIPYVLKKDNVAWTPPIYIYPSKRFNTYSISLWDSREKAAEVIYNLLNTTKKYHPGKDTYICQVCIWRWERSGDL